MANNYEQRTMNYLKQTQTKPTCSELVEPILKGTADRMGNKLQGVCCDIDDFLDDFSVAMLIFGYFCEDVFNSPLLHIRRANNLDVKAPLSASAGMTTSSSPG